MVGSSCEVVGGWRRVGEEGGGVGGRALTYRSVNGGKGC